MSICLIRVEAKGLPGPELPDTPTVESRGCQVRNFRIKISETSGQIGRAGSKQQKQKFDPPSIAISSPFGIKALKREKTTKEEENQASSLSPSEGTISVSPK
jgi:hypothetical protein